MSFCCINKCNKSIIIGQVLIQLAEKIHILVLFLPQGCVNRRLWNSSWVQTLKSWLLGVISCQHGLGKKKKHIAHPCHCDYFLLLWFSQWHFLLQSRYLMIKADESLDFLWQGEKKKGEPKFSDSPPFTCICCFSGISDHLTSLCLAELGYRMQIAMVHTVRLLYVNLLLNMTPYL